MVAGSHIGRTFNSYHDLLSQCISCLRIPLSTWCYINSQLQLITKRNGELQVKDLPKVPSWLECDWNLRLSGRKAPNLTTELSGSTIYLSNHQIIYICLPTYLSIESHHPGSGVAFYNPIIALVHVMCTWIDLLL